MSSELIHYCQKSSHYDGCFFLEYVEEVAICA